MPDHPSLDAVAAGGFDQSVDGSPMRSGRVDSDPTIDSLSARERDGADMVFGHVDIGNSLAKTKVCAMLLCSTLQVMRCKLGVRALAAFGEEHALERGF